MSTVTLVIIHKRRIALVQAHWRTVKSLLAAPAALGSIREQIINPALDAGYILVDSDARIIVNSQNAFALPRMNRWNVVEA